MVKSIKTSTHLPNDLDNQIICLERQQKKLAYECAKFGKIQESKLVDILNNENYDLLTDLYVATGGPKKLIDYYANKKLFNLVKEYDVYKKQLAGRQTNHKEIDEQIRLIKKKAISAQSKVCTDVQHQARVIEAQKTVEKLENKLDTVVKTWGTVNEENRLLRDDIDHYLHERASFQTLWNKKIDNLRQGKKIMLDLIEQATIAYNKRDEVVAMLDVLREKSHTDYLLHADEMETLQRQRDHKKQLKTFMLRKNQKRCMTDLLKTKKQKSANMRIQTTKELIKKRNILDTLWKFTGTKSLEDFISAFSKANVENYNSFVYILKLKSDVASLTGEILSLKGDITEQKSLSLYRAKNRAQTVNRLQMELKTSSAARDFAEKDYVRADKTLKKLFQGIYKLFTLCKGSASQFIELLGDNVNVNEYNVSLFLSALDEQISSLLLSTYYNQNVKAVTKNKTKPGLRLINNNMTPYPLKPLESIVRTTPCPLCVEKEQVNNVIDELQYICNRMETQGRLKLLLKLPNACEKMHNVSQCRLPKSRAIIQRRYQ